jgi:hypothetical protein
MNTENVKKQRGTITEAKKIQLKFWEKFSNYLQQKQSFIIPGKPAPQCYMNTKLANGFALSATASYKNSARNSFDSEELRASIIFPQGGEEYYPDFLAEKEKIEKEFGSSLVWYEPRANRRGRIFLRKDIDLRDESQWAEYHNWLMSNMEKLYQVFDKRIAALEAKKMAQYIS